MDEITLLRTYVSSLEKENASKSNELSILHAEIASLG